MNGEEGKLTPFSTELDSMFRRMGLGDPTVLASVFDRWEELAGEPWSTRSRPRSLEESKLVVEAHNPSSVAFLRYASDTLVERLAATLGEGLITSVEVVPPSRR